MDINKLLGGVRCSCGKYHTCDIKYVYIENNATQKLEQICNDYKKVLIVADQNTYQAAGQITEKYLLQKQIERVIFGKEILIPNEQAINAVMEKLGDSDIIVGIGSGVIQDLCKYVSHKSAVPYIIVATAPSMDGYASTGAAMILDGMKVTCAAGLPLAIVADTSVIANAPMEMLKAGFGDIVGKYSALNDWKLSQVINGEYFCDYIYDITYNQVEITLELAKGILKRNPKSIEALMEALVVIGIMMSFATTSRPASGSEHHLSHYFEIVGIITNKGYFSHGIDVAYSTVETAKLRQKLLDIDFERPIFRLPQPEYQKKMNEIYKQVASGCIELQEKVGYYEKDLAEIYAKKQKQIKEILAESPTANQIEEMLELVELDLDEFYEFYGQEKIKNAIFYAKDLKDRYSVLWLYYDLCGE